MEVFDTIIVGAGAAGLTAGYELSRAGRSVKILEASNRIGGRIRNAQDTFADFPVSLGGEWIHVPVTVLDTIVNDPLNKVNVTTILYSPAYRYWWGPDQAWQSEGYVPGDTSFVDSSWFDFFEKYIAPETASAVTLNCVVNTVDHRDPAIITVGCDDGRSYRTRSVISTVSVGVMDAIAWTPQLSAAKRAAFSAIEMDPGLKVFLKFTEKFYFDAFHICDTAEQCMANGDFFFYDATYSHTTTEHVLGVFIFADLAIDVINLSDQQVIQLVLSRLDKIHQGMATKTFTGKSIVQNWSKEPFVKGAYSDFLRDSNYNGLDAMLAPESNGRVYFAGEALDEGYNNGFVHGAALSGQSVAQKLLDTLDFPEPNPTPSPTPLPTQKPASGGICFSGSSTVQLENGAHVPMSELQIGDRILVSQSSIGRKAFEPIYSFGHANHEVVADYLRITTADGSVIEISRDHMVFQQVRRRGDGVVVGGDDQKRIPVPAGRLEVGDVLSAGAIQSIQQVRARGAFAPFTPSGRLIVSGGVEVSSFVALPLDPELPVSASSSPAAGPAALVFGLVSHHRMAHAFEAPHRLFCHHLRACSEEYTEEGLSTWVAAPFSLGNALMRQHWLLRGIITSLLFVILMVFWAAELLVSLAFKLHKVWFV